MKYFLGLVALTAFSSVGGMPVMAQTESAGSLFLAYPPPEHETTAEKIFLIGTASPTGEVTVNGKSIERSDVGHFAPSFPLEMGEEEFEWITNQVEQQRLASAIAQGIEEWFASVN